MTCLTLTPKATIFSVMVNQIKMSAGIELHKLCHVILKNYLVAADHLTRTNSFHSRTKMVFLLAPWQDQIHQELLYVNFVIVQLILMSILCLKC